jgi:hypothetical protein
MLTGCAVALGRSCYSPTRLHIKAARLALNATAWQLGTMSERTRTVPEYFIGVASTGTIMAIVAPYLAGWDFLALR